jgi:hypothetical protein
MTFPLALSCPTPFHFQPQSNVSWLSSLLTSLFCSCLNPFIVLLQLLCSVSWSRYVLLPNQQPQSGPCTLGARPPIKVLRVCYALWLPIIENSSTFCYFLLRYPQIRYVEIGDQAKFQREQLLVKPENCHGKMESPSRPISPVFAVEYPSLAGEELQRR